MIYRFHNNIYIYRLGTYEKKNNSIRRCQQNISTTMFLIEHARMSKAWNSFFCDKKFYIDIYQMMFACAFHREFSLFSQNIFQVGEASCILACKWNIYCWRLHQMLISSPLEAMNFYFYFWLVEAMNVDIYFSSLLLSQITKITNFTIQGKRVHWWFSKSEQII